MPIEKHYITSRDQWLTWRKSDVTASAIGALFGVHDYLTPLELYMLKTGQIVEDPDEAPAMRRGRLLEPVALQLLQEERPTWKMVEDPGKTYYRDPDARIGATPDSIWVDPDREGFGIVQIKTVEPFMFRKKWNPDGMIDPPTWIVLQAYVEAVMTGAAWACVAPMRVGFGIDLDLIEIPLDVDLMGTIKEKVADFWRMVADGEEPPADYARDGDLLRKIYSETGKHIVDLTRHNRIGELCEEKVRWAYRKTSCERALDVIDNEIIDILGDAPAAEHPDWNITRKTVNMKERVQAAYSYRALRVNLET